VRFAKPMLRFAPTLAEIVAPHCAMQGVTIAEQHIEFFIFSLFAANLDRNISQHFPFFRFFLRTGVARPARTTRA
jgi:hypothetical protein